jgi:hypothetical protein
LEAEAAGMARRCPCHEVLAVLVPSLTRVGQGCEWRTVLVDAVCLVAER